MIVYLIIIDQLQYTKYRTINADYFLLYLMCFRYTARLIDHLNCGKHYIHQPQNCIDRIPMGSCAIDRIEDEDLSDQMQYRKNLADRVKSFVLYQSVYRCEVKINRVFDFVKVTQG